MNTGSEHLFHFEILKCTVTGRKIKRISPAGIHSHHPYFYNKIFTGDGRKVLLASLLNGCRDYYLVDLKTGKTVQMTDSGRDGAVDDFSGFISPCDNYVYFTRNQSVFRIHRNTLKEELIYEKPIGWTVGGPIQISSDGRKLIMVQNPEKEIITDRGDGWKNFLAQTEAGLRTRLVLYNAAEKTIIEICDTERYRSFNPKGKNGQWLTHCQFRPGDDSFISYCHEGLGGTVDARIWFLTGANHEPLCGRIHDYPGQIISHEFWFKDGSRLGYVKIPCSDAPVTTICLVDPESLLEEEIVTLPRTSHFITSHDDRFIVADAAPPDPQLMTPELVKPENWTNPEDLFIYIVNIKEKSYLPLVAHKSSYKPYGKSTQDAHPHPSFSPDNGAILYTSDFEGLPAVYMVDINQE